MATGSGKKRRLSKTGRQPQGFYRCRKGSQKRERRTTPSKADASDGELNWLVFHSELKVVSRELVTFIGWEY